MHLSNEFEDMTELDGIEDILCILGVSIEKKTGFCKQVLLLTAFFLFSGITMIG